MIIKFGKVKVDRKDVSEYEGSFEMEVFVTNINGRDYVSAAVVSDTNRMITPPYGLSTCCGINIGNEDDIMLLFERFGAAPYGVKSYEWIEPLHEVA